MKISNIKRKLESVGVEVSIVAEPAQWGGWNVTMWGRIEGYYDVKVSEQIHKTLDVRTEQDTVAVFLTIDTDYFCTKPYHDESDIMTDYCAWSFHHRIKDIEWCVKSAREMVRTGTASA